MQWNREEYLELMSFGDCRRPMFVELFGLMPGLEEEWRLQGAAQGEIELVDFGWDYVPVVSCGGSTGAFGGSPAHAVEEKKDHTIFIDELGRRCKLYRGTATLPHPLEYPVRDMESWQKLKPLLEYREERIDWALVDDAKRAQTLGALVVADIPGGFDLPRELMGEETACLCYYDQPELMVDILDTAGDTAFRVLDRISDTLIIDNLTVHEDLAGKSGPLPGPKQIQRFIRPYYRRIWDMLQTKGSRLFSLDSDGNVNSVIDAFLDCGVNVMLPMEPAAGMDMVKSRRRYGNRLAFKGGIDKFALLKGRHAIKRELDYKLKSMVPCGGVAFGLDHRIPEGTLLDDYRWYADLGREILGLPARREAQKGWKRMAF